MSKNEVKKSSGSQPEKKMKTLADLIKELRGLGHTEDVIRHFTTVYEIAMRLEKNEREEFIKKLMDYLRGGNKVDFMEFLDKNYPKGNGNPQPSN